jgi:hypothetical protein
VCAYVFCHNPCEIASRKDALGRSERLARGSPSSANRPNAGRREDTLGDDNEEYGTGEIHDRDRVLQQARVRSLRWKRRDLFAERESDVLKPAVSLEELYKTLTPGPLLDAEQLKAFYRDEVVGVRGDDVVALLDLALQRAFDGFPYKAFLMGHPGVGKSTELTRLIERQKSRYRAIRISASSELAPANFKVFDVLLLLMVRVSEATNQEVESGAIDIDIPASLAEDVLGYFATEVDKKSETSSVGGNVEAGAGLKDGSLWASLFGLFANIKGEIKYASNRSHEIVEYRLNRLSTLVDLLNRFLDFVNTALQEGYGQQWLFIIEDFEKFGISGPQLQDMFVNYGSVFEQLRAHLIFTIPVGLVYSRGASRLPFASDCRFMIRDTPVYNADHTPHEEGRQALRAVLEARVDPALFAEGQLMSLIIASGGNLRDLFAMVRHAGDNAILRKPAVARIESSDITKAINAMRLEYTRNLGDSPYDLERISYEQKMAKLVAVWRSEPSVNIPDAVLYSLLRSRAVQEFNGRGRFGLHPLVVDILKNQKQLDESAAGGTV